MNSIIFQVAARMLLPVMLVLSFVVLLRGHNEPGGGFIGGLLAAAGFALHTLAIGLADARRLIIVHPRTLAGIGLLFAVLSGVPGMFTGASFLTALWVTVTPPGFEQPLKIGTPLIFDIGVYCVVVGITLLMVFTLEERQG